MALNVTPVKLPYIKYVVSNGVDQTTIFDYPIIVRQNVNQFNDIIQTGDTMFVFPQTISCSYERLQRTKGFSFVSDFGNFYPFGINRCK